MTSGSGSDRRPPPGPTSSRRLATTPGLRQRVSIPSIEICVERVAGQPSNHVVVFDGDMCRLGSHDGNDLVLADAKVSRFHCRLARTSDAWRIDDTGSLNGTRVAGVRVYAADLPMPECRIELGDSIVRVRELGSRQDAEVPLQARFGALYGGSIVARRLFGLLDKVSRSESNVLIEGESGTGKELVTTEIVQRGPRKDQPFVVVDCGAISPSLIESELFGHVRGAFTGADRDRVGAFLEADRGTLFLDEVGELPLELQPKLLRALEAREIRRVGENRSQKVDVRVIAATNRRLEREVNHGRFREDLYFRLSVVTVRLPPLRERLEDVSMLVNVFLDAMNASDRARSLFTPTVLADMARYDWPGNVRELKNYVERALVLENAPPARRVASPSVAPGPGAGPPSGEGEEVDLDVAFTAAKEHLVADFELRYLRALLEWAGGNVSRAARRAGMDRMYLYRLLRKHDITGASFKE